MVIKKQVQSLGWGNSSCQADISNKMTPAKLMKFLEPAEGLLLTLPPALGTARHGSESSLGVSSLGSLDSLVWDHRWDGALVAWLHETCSLGLAALFSESSLVVSGTWCHTKK